MKDIDRLISIAQDLNMLSETAQLCLIKQRFNNDNCELILPLVGEFSAGKTTLINALTDSKRLETATKPTTATIYEIHFGCDSCYAEVFDEKGDKTTVQDIASLKNEALSDAVVVNVFDTAKEIPSGIILVDTPGLSSSDPRHKQTLVDFLPKADGVLLVVDVNQQITRSLIDFVETTRLARRPVFLVITKCDTKSESELDTVKKYIADNCKLSLNQVACVSAKKGDVYQIHELLQSVQHEKKRILEEVNAQRVNEIIKQMLVHIDEMLKASSSDSQLDEAIREKELELRKIDRQIDHILSTIQDDIEDEQRQVVRKFQDTINERLDGIVAGKSDNYNAEAVSAINSVASICLNDFKNRVTKVAQKRIKEESRTDDEMNLQSIESIDVSSLSVSGLSFDLNLEAIGHEYDGMIATGVKVAAAAAAVAAIVATAGGAAGAAGAVGAAGTAVEAGEVAATAAEVAIDAGAVIETVDIASDIGSIVSNSHHISRVQQMVNYAGQASEQYGKIDSLNTAAGQQMGQKRGIVESMVGFVTDKTWGKPQRRRAISNYVDETLLPQFRTAMDGNLQTVIDNIRESLHLMAQVTIEEKKTLLEQLRQQRQDQKAAFEQRLEAIRDYKNELLTM